MEQSEAAAYHKILSCTKVVCQANAWVEVLPLRVQHGRGPSLPFPANTAVEREPARGPPFVHDVESVIGMGKLALGLVVDRGGARRPLVHGSAAPRLTAPLPGRR